jgi:ATP-binding cassette subfamily B multidrug efflux pump
VIAQTLVSFGEQWAIQLLGQRAMHGLRLAIYDHVVSRRAAFFDRMPVGRLLTRMTNDIESVNEMFASGVITLRPTRSACWRSRSSCCRSTSS